MVQYQETDGKVSVNLVSRCGRISEFPIGEWRLAASGPDRSGVTVVHRWHAAPDSVYKWRNDSSVSMIRLSGNDLVPTNIARTLYYPGYSGNVGLIATGLPTQSEIATANK